MSNYLFAYDNFSETERAIPVDDVICVFPVIGFNKGEQTCDIYHKQLSSTITENDQTTYYLTRTRLFIKKYSGTVENWAAEVSEAVAKAIASPNSRIEFKSREPGATLDIRQPYPEQL